MEHPHRMTGDVEFPDARMNVLAALESLADPDHQQRVWRDRTPRADDPVNDFDLAVHTLFDDTRVLENPEPPVGEVLASEREVRAARDLAAVLGPLIDELGDVGDEVYLDSPRWPAVVTAARTMLETMNADH
ncbi:SCO4402 family protein [Streptomyces sp. 1222.5]|uniref:SCO4402 family protein n=1 Tax=Streptomyces sp. 1222.5 TaxID=1881026 RepID=UPI003EB9DFA8